MSVAPRFSAVTVAIASLSWGWVAPKAIATPTESLFQAEMAGIGVPLPVSSGHWERPETVVSAQTIQVAQVRPDVPLPPPQDVTPPEPETPLPIPAPLPPPEDLLRPPAGIPTPIEPGIEIPSTITVERFQVEGSTVFSESELAETLAPFTGRPITFAELLQARSAVTQRYIDAGYITSGAFIPAGQVIEDGVVTIQVVEGTLEDIQIEGLRRLNPGYVRSRIRAAAGRPLNVNNLLQGLQLLQLNPLIESLSAELAAGIRPGQSILYVQVDPASTLSAQVTLDNGRSPSVGSFRRRAQISEANLLGQGDGLGVSYSNTDGSDSWDVEYVLPFNAYDGTLGVLYSSTNSEVIEDPFDILGIESESETWDVTLRQPLVRTPSEEFALAFSLTHRSTQTSIQPPDFPRIGFPLTEGANDEGETQLTALRFAQEWTRRDSQQVTALRSQFSLGTDWFGATINEEGVPDSHFLSWQGQAQWVRLLDTDMLLLTRANVQLADRSLLSLEQIGLGGQGSVRGYRQDQILSDNGIFASVELRVPIFRIDDWDSLVQITPFVDYGKGWNNGDRADPDPSHLVSVGVGLLWQVSDRVTARVDWGIPLNEVDSSGDSLQEDGIFFTITGRLF